jgi:hypothetical protein
MSDDQVNRKHNLAALLVRIVLGLIAAGMLIPLLILMFRRLRGQGNNRNSGTEAESLNPATPYTYRGKHEHEDHTHGGEAVATP